MSSQPARPGRILVGEDTAEFAHFIHQVLEHVGYEVEVARDGVACLERARASHPDLIILDIMMPKMHGIDVLKALQEDPHTRDIGVLMCTAKDFRTERARSLELGAFDVLAKPFEAATLLEKVHAYFSEQGREAPPVRVARAAREKEEDPHVPALDLERPELRIWGVRGSIPAPGGRFLRHGGNTSCLSITVGDECFIFDAGSGIRELGTHLLASQIRRLHLFITHTHWDHIQGFPFFAPAYRDDVELTIYGARGFGKDLPALFQGQLDPDYFPVQLEHLGADIEFIALDDGPLTIGPLTVSWEFATHPGATLAYRLDIRGRSLVWAPDNEIFQGYKGDPVALHRGHPAAEPFSAFIRFLEGAQMVIHEAQYTNEEYVDRVGFGHSSVTNAAALMNLAGVGRWLITHHDPAHDDDFLERKLALTRQALERMGHVCEVRNAYEGFVDYL